MKFEVHKTSGNARKGLLTFERGEVRTPAFMPVGTYGTVKAMTPDEVRESGADIILGNTFHLMLRPGTEVIEKHGGLHDFMRWHRPTFPPANVAASVRAFNRYRSRSRT